MVLHVGAVAGLLDCVPGTLSCILIYSVMVYTLYVCIDCMLCDCMCMCSVVILKVISLIITRGV